MTVIAMGCFNQGRLTSQLTNERADNTIELPDKAFTLTATPSLTKVGGISRGRIVETQEQR